MTNHNYIFSVRGFKPSLSAFLARMVMLNGGFCFGEDMPYKDKAQQRLAYKRWVKRNKEKVAIDAERAKVAKLHHPERKKCTVLGCTIIGERHHPDPDIYEEIVWLCKKHHEEEHHKEDRKCDTDDCDRKHEARGLCNMHYLRILRKDKVKKGVDDVI